MGISGHALQRTIALLMAMAGWLFASLGLGGEIAARRRAFQVEFDQQLAELTNSHQNNVEKAWLARWRIHGDPNRQYLFLPDFVGLSNSSASNPVNEPTSFRVLRKRHAQQIYDLVSDAVASGDDALAVQLLFETICFDEEHQAASRQLGLATTGKRPKTNSVRRGRRPERRLQWPAAGYWEVKTPHFRIVSNDSEETTRALAVQLEVLYGVWQQLFFEGPKRRRSSDDPLVVSNRNRDRHQVVLFGTREAYVTHVSQLDRRAPMTRGYYHAATKTAYFVGDPQRESSTWKHEATHQLCHELWPTNRNAGIHRDFWVIEGIALYMESLQRCRRWWTVGGIEADRLQFARFRALRENFRVPIENLLEMGRDELQSEERIGAIYSQCAGLTHFFMNDHNGVHRRKFLQYLKNVYVTPRSKRSLLQEVDMTFAEIEGGYHDFLRVNDRQLQEIDPQASILNLCFIGGDISDDGLKSLPNFDNARWIDLFATHITDDGTIGLSRASRLRQLNLENTPITDTTVERLAKSSELTILDLSRTQISDKCLPVIGTLSKLQSLWLTGTPVTDTGIRELANLSSLRHLELSGTNVSASARRQLKQALPHLKIEPQD